MKTLAILNGPNLNVLGTREPEIYGTETLTDLITTIKAHIQLRYPEKQLNILHFQSNHEGELIDFIHKLLDKTDELIGLVVNLGAYTHSSIALHDALRTLKSPIIEVHISNTAQRESFRHYSYVAPLATGVINGLGKWGYLAAADYLVNHDPS